MLSSQSLREEVFSISKTKAKSVVEVDGVMDDFDRESMALAQFRLSHARDSGKLGFILSVPK